MSHLVVSKLLVLGAGGHAKVVAETALASGHVSDICFLDDHFYNSTQEALTLGRPVLGPLDFVFEKACIDEYSEVVVAIGHATTRLRWIKSLIAAGYSLPSVVHPTAFVSPSVQIGPASVVFAHVAMQAQASIGMGVILNTGCSIDHDCKLDDAVHICPGARLAGEVHVGKRSWIGIGASVINQIRIGSDVTIGAGAAVVTDIPDGITAVGVPARPLSRN
ncbi:acetyltransferase [Synechococcus sp. WH 8016]|uniref:acetyltransferase n=1 Tax=Synechococcus sp. WH 8016 TaxID=166318 RepID=UPI001C1E8285|nr:acetyltransferase [Synechococcus sp. WH 8016]